MAAVGTPRFGGKASVYSTSRPLEHRASSVDGRNDVSSPRAHGELDVLLPLLISSSRAHFFAQGRHGIAPRYQPNPTALLLPLPRVSSSRASSFPRAHHLSSISTRAHLSLLLHSCSNEMLITDLDTDRPLWKLSSYGPASNTNLVDGKDISYEELRMKMLESGGNQAAYVRLVSAFMTRQPGLTTFYLLCADSDGK